MNEHEILGTTSGDETKKTCEFYSQCDNWITLWLGETSGQDVCSVCGATSYYEFGEDEEASQ